MSRFLLVLVLLLSVSLPAAAQLTDGPPMPAAMDLNKVAIGAWAEYNVGMGQMPAMKTRMSLVARDKGLATVEMVVQGGMMAAAGGKMTMQTVMGIDAAQEGTVKKLVLQVGDNDPMEMPNEIAQKKQFQKPDPKSLVKEESVTVAAGTFKAKHYRNKTAKGDVMDYWISDRVPPFGLVKVVGEQKAGPAAGKGPVTFELVGSGKDAKTSIVRAVKPFDQQAFMSQLMNSARAATATPPPAAGAAGGTTGGAVAPAAPAK